MPTPADQGDRLTPILPSQPKGDGDSRATEDDSGSKFGPSLDGLAAPVPPEDDQHREERVPDLSITRGDKPLSMVIDGPASARVGDEVTFQITVSNVRQQAIEGVTVLCSLPEGLSFPGAPQQAFRQRVGRLTADNQQILELSLVCESAGRHCVDFHLTADGFDEISRSACVSCYEKTVELDLTGPEERTIGSRAEFVLTVTNRTGREQPDVHVILTHENVLKPQAASTGVIRHSGRLEWDLGLVRVDERVRIQAEFACLSATPRAVLTAHMTGRELRSQDVTAIVQVAPPRGIALDVVDEQDLVALGEKLSYLVTVTNRGDEPISDLTVQFDPDGVQPLGVTSNGVNLLPWTDADHAAGTLSVALAEALSPGNTRVIELQAIATHPGRGGLQAIASSTRHPLRVSTTELTIINPIQGSIVWDAH